MPAFSQLLPDTNDIGIHFIDNTSGICEIGYTVRPEYQRQGYGKEAVIGVIRYLFDTLNKNEINAFLDPSNDASKRLVEKIGFKIRKERETDQNDLVYVLFKKDLEPNA